MAYLSVLSVQCLKHDFNRDAALALPLLLLAEEARVRIKNTRITEKNFPLDMEVETTEFHCPEFRNVTPKRACDHILGDLTMKPSTIRATLSLMCEFPELHSRGTIAILGSKIFITGSMLASPIIKDGEMELHPWINSVRGEANYICNP